MPRISTTDLDVFPLCLGGNVFGWNVDEAGSFAVLDAYAAAGGNFIDTADVYSSWAEGHSGGESEAVIGRWMAARGNRDRMIIATKVAKLETTAWAVGSEHPRSRRGLAPPARHRSHRSVLLPRGRPERPARRDARRVRRDSSAEGKVRYIGASNFDAERLDEALEVSQTEGLVSVRRSPAALQPGRAQLRERPPRCLREARARLHPVLRAREGLPDRQVPRRRCDGRERSRRRRHAVPQRPGRSCARVLDELAADPCDHRRRRRARVARGAAHGRRTDRERPYARAARRAAADGRAGTER